MTRGYIIGMITRWYVIYGHSDEILDVMELLMQVVHPVSECPHYNNNLKFCSTYIIMVTIGYFQHLLDWWLEVILTIYISIGNIIFENSDELLKWVT